MYVDRICKHATNPSNKIQSLQTPASSSALFERWESLENRNNYIMHAAAVSFTHINILPLTTYPSAHRCFVPWSICRSHFSPALRQLVHAYLLRWPKCWIVMAWTCTETWWLDAAGLSALRLVQIYIPCCNWHMQVTWGSLHGWLHTKCHLSRHAHAKLNTATTQRSTRSKQFLMTGST